MCCNNYLFEIFIKKYLLIKEYFSIKKIFIGKHLFINENNLVTIEILVFYFKKLRF